MLPSTDPPRLGGRCTCHLWALAESGQWGSIYPPPRCPVHDPSPAELIRQMLGAHLASRREDPEFRARIRRSIEENREILDRLSG